MTAPPGPEPLSTIVLVLPTARTIGAQLRIGRGRRLDEIRADARVLLVGSIR